MIIEQFLSQHSGSFPEAFNSRYYSQNLPEEVRELAHWGLHLFPVGLAAKLNGCPDSMIADATSEISTLEELSTATQTLWGYRLALGPSRLCVLILEGTVGRASFDALIPELDESATLHARYGDDVYAIFRQPTGMKRIASARKLAPGVSILGDGHSCVVPPSGGAFWSNPGAEIETLPHLLRELAFENPDNPPGRTMPAPKPFPRPDPSRSTARFPKPNRGLRKGYPDCGHSDWRGYRVSRRR